MMEHTNDESLSSWKRTDAAFQQMIDEGHYDHYQEEYRFIEVHGRKWF